MLLGLKDENPDKEKSGILDNAWSLMEIMGVGIVDMKTWNWMYENPEANSCHVKTKTLSKSQLIPGTSIFHRSRC